MRKVAVLASASGNGKTTFGRALAQRLDVPFVELDAIAHKANWTEATAEEMRAQVEPVVAGDGWVIDGGYRNKLGDLVLTNADTIVWLDLPVWVWLPRLVRRTIRRVVRGEELWNGNRETFRKSFLSRDSVIYFATRRFVIRRRLYPQLLAPYHVIRLRSRREVELFLAEIG
jgi:adenylate kinase family enzyme